MKQTGGIPGHFARLAASVLGLAAAVANSSCNTIVGLRREVTRLEDQGAVVVRVAPLPTDGVTTYAAAVVSDRKGRRSTVGLQTVRSDGLAAIYLPAGASYSVVAFADLDANRRLDPGEPCGVLREVRPMALASTRGRHAALPLELRRNNPEAPGVAVEIPPENKKLGGKIDFALGEVASLDEPRFAPEGGGAGLWRPFEFLTGNTVGLYFTEPYDPRRTPVVFVYGIGGSPQDWRWMLDQFPRERHQLWFYHYPSGMRLERVAIQLSNSLAAVARRHSFRDCQIVAHSMGGLVCRAAILDLAANHPEVRVPRFVSVSTPWGGHSAAASGVRHLRKPVPSWLDVEPDSAFLAGLYRLPLPAATRHTLIYGRKTKHAPWLEGENDGTVEVASETDRRATAEAVQVTELPYEHVEILNQPRTLELVRRGLR
jgi:pimeloyl-ACP methyl ester carboxylesterase